jgi:hypothetical protein
VSTETRTTASAVVIFDMKNAIADDRSPLRSVTAAK